MSRPIRWFALALVAGALPLPVQAQRVTSRAVAPDASRVLFEATDTVKNDDGPGYVTLRFQTVYDPVTGAFIETITDAATGAERSRTVSAQSVISPTPEEEAVAVALVRAHPEIAPLIAAAEHEVRVEGGFALLRELGHGCGPGSRCLQYDVYEVVPGETFARRLRYTVVDLRAVRVFSADFDVAREGNLANPAAPSSAR